MIVDSSALVAILLGEPDGQAFAAAIDQSASAGIAAPNVVEAAMVLVGRVGPAANTMLDEFLTVAEIRTVPFTADHAAVARQAFLRYGKGRHAAGLNFGDCIAYATAKLEQMPLLFKGDDFRRTDVEPALPS
ncbi:type II toxin-antitoxin system VapC family toxin [Mesorhizobium sp. CN2-181]|uniref:type II toxin-antitoxin system VapC family toxin n=1 Tax=Mesorhizobium yinganensis TaxID=3157707 RepID=UPI0032B7DB4A